jgi:hypothetical protein
MAQLHTTVNDAITTLKQNEAQVNVDPVPSVDNERDDTVEHMLIICEGRTYI